LLGKGFDVTRIFDVIDIAQNTYDQVLQISSSQTNVSINYDNCYVGYGQRHCFDSGVVINKVENITCSYSTLFSNRSGVVSWVASSIGVRFLGGISPKFQYYQAFENQQPYALYSCRFTLYSVSLQNSTPTSLFSGMLQEQILERQSSGSNLASSLFSKFGTDVITGFQVGVGFTVGVSVAGIACTSSELRSNQSFMDLVTVAIESKSFFNAEQGSQFSSGLITSMSGEVYSGQYRSNISTACLLASKKPGCFLYTALENPTIISVSSTPIYTYAGSYYAQLRIADKMYTGPIQYSQRSFENNCGIPRQPSQLLSGDGKRGCFSRTDSVYIESGKLKKIKDVQIGEGILITPLNGDVTKMQFSKVIAKPHGDNNITAFFIQIATMGGLTIKVTSHHLVLGGTCGFVLNLVQAKQVQVGQCLQTTSGQQKVRHIRTTTGIGVYTLVTFHDGLLVVNGIVASPFPISHRLPNLFFNVHRAVHYFSASFATSSLFLFCAEEVHSFLIRTFYLLGMF